MTILPKTIYRFNAVPIKLPMVFHRTRTNNFTICMEIQKTLNSKSLKEEVWTWMNQFFWLHPLLQCYSHWDSIVLSQEKRNIDQRNKIESLETNPCTYGHFILEKGDKHIKHYCILSALKQYKCIIFQFWRSVRSLKCISLGQNQSVSRAVFHSGGFKGESVFLLFPTS